MEQFIPQCEPVSHDPFAGPAISHLVPTTEPQKEIWLAAILGGEDANRCYNESVTLLLNGTVNRHALTAAFKELVTRHESLRATFSSDGLTMMVYNDLPLMPGYTDLSLLTDSQQQAHLAELATADMLKSFDLKNGPLMRAAIIKLSQESEMVRLTAHHIVCDGWSMGVIINELGQLYTAYSLGKVPGLAPAPDYAAYASYQASSYSSDEYLAAEKYWLAQFNPLPQALNLPTDFERPAIRTFKSQRDDYPLSKTLVNAVKKAGAKAGCSLVTTMLAAFEVLLHNVSGQDEIVVGLPSAGQSAAGIDNLIGHCVNLLPLRSYPRDEMRFSDYLKARKKSVFDAYDHQQYTFGSLLKNLNLARDRSRPPLVPVVFNIDMAMNNGVSFEGLKHSLISNPRAFETFEIFLNATGTEDALILEWSYNTQLFVPSTIKGMMHQYELILKTITENIDVEIGGLKPGETSSEPFVYSGNDTSVPYPANHCLHSLIREQAILTPKARAVIFGNEVQTYKELEKLSDKIARGLCSSGIQVGDVVALAISRSVNMAAAMLGILKSGAAYVPVDPEYPADRITYMLHDSGAKIIIADTGFTSGAGPQVTVTTLNRLLNDAVKSGPATLLPEVESSRRAYILYTSGSTGKPKGVQITHRNLVNMMCSFRDLLKVTPADKILGLTTVSFDISGMELYLPLLAGAAVDIVPAATTKDAKALLAHIRMSRPTIMQATPATWQMLLEAGWDKNIRVKTIVCGGEAMTRSLAEKLLLRTDRLFNGYGPTETTIYSTAKLISLTDEVITIGKPIANTRVYILDNKGQPVSENQAGEIYIGGDGVGIGYLNQDELTAARFIADPFSSDEHARIYSTGDLGKFLPNGDIQCLGRADQQIKVRGFRIEPGEVEYCLQLQPEIAQSAVIAREDEPGNQRLVAYLVLRKAVSVDINVLITACKAALKKFVPAYMCPNDFVILDQMPMTPNGKIDRKVLPKPVRSSNIANSDAQPESKEQVALARIWSKVLSVDNPGIRDDFFEAGGHSLIAVKLMSVIEKEMGVILPVSVLFECPTIELLAEKLVSREPAKLYQSLVTMKKGGTKMPLYIVHGARGTVPIFNRTIGHLHPDQPIYGLQARGLDGKSAIVETVEEIAANYVAEVIANNPGGPYALAGYSFGGIIAFEMARQLKKQNREVKALIIFDTDADAPNPTHSRFAASLNRLRIFGMRKLYAMGALIKNPADRFAYEAEQLKNNLHPLYRRVKSWIEGREKDLFYYKYKIEETNLRAKRKYRMQPYDGVIELFRADKKTYYLDDYTYLGWKPFAASGVRVHEIPGEHNKIFLPPNVNELARKLQLCLDNAVKEDGSFADFPLFYHKRMMEAV